MSLNNENGTEHLLKDTIKTLISVIEIKDPFMKGHAERVAASSVRFARTIGLTDGEVNQIYIAGLLHDIGIVYIPPEISRKKGPLNNEEMEMIKKHPLISEKIISKYNILKGILPIIRHHHESFDGSGYPDGIRGEQIPLGARIINIVNAYDSMVNTRENIPAGNIDGAIEEIRINAGKQFDDALVNDFIAFIKPGRTAPDPLCEKDDKAAEETTSGNIPLEDSMDISGAKSAEDIIDRIIKRFKRGDIDLPVLPKVVQEIRDSMSKPNATVDTLGSVIERDAVISLKLISVANSPMYRGTEKIQTVKQAIPRLGIKETQGIVNTIANKGLYQTKSNRFKTIMEDLWLNSLATAYGAKCIAKSLVPGETEKYFLMGLIHNIGKILLIKVFGEIEVHGDTLDLDEVIEGIREAHTGFGSTILRQWGFAEEFARVALLHEGPAFKPTTDRSVLAVNLAGNIAKKLGFCLEDHHDLDLLRLDSTIRLELEPGEVTDIEEETKALMEDTSGIF